VVNWLASASTIIQDKPDAFEVIMINQSAAFYGTKENKNIDRQGTKNIDRQGTKNIDRQGTKNIEYKKCLYSIHAEVSCIMNCKDKSLISRSTMYLIKLNEGIGIECEPCRVCREYLLKYKIKRIKILSK
jgi:deoxycytidylate deaminase